MKAVTRSGRKSYAPKYLLYQEKSKNDTINVIFTVPEMDNMEVINDFNNQVIDRQLRMNINDDNSIHDNSIHENNEDKASLKAVTSSVIMRFAPKYLLY